MPFPRIFGGGRVIRAIGNIANRLSDSPEARTNRVANNPAIQAAIEVAQSFVNQNTRDHVANQIIEAVSNNDTAANSADAENPARSRINVGNITAFLGWLSTLALIFGYATGQNDLPAGINWGDFLANSGAWVGMIVGIAGHIITWIGRNLGGLKPLKFLLPWTWFGIGR